MSFWGPVLVVSAPGKVVISGEYAVLGGTTAVVAAVDLRARVALSRRSGDGSPEEGSLPPEVLHSRREAERVLGERPVTLSLDTTALRVGDRKLGVGSSAAAAVAAAGAIAAAHGRTFVHLAERREVMQFAFDGHRSIAPQGSGVDVAASALGGFLSFRRDGERVEAQPLAWPAGLVPVLLWTGVPARTSELVARVDALRARDPSAHERAIAPVREAATAFVSAVAAGRTSEAIAALDAHGVAMAALGEAASAPIVTPALARAAVLAREVGGAAKPSGAGGGDVAIALVPSVAAADALRAACAAEAIEPVAAHLGAEGVRVEAGGSL